MATVLVVGAQGCLGTTMVDEIPHAGLAPGLGYLLAAELLRSHPQASEIAVGMTFSSGALGEAGIRWLFSHFAESERSKERMVPLPPPVNDRICGVNNTTWHVLEGE